MTASYLFLLAATPQNVPDGDDVTDILGIF